MSLPEIPQDAIEAAANQMRSQIGDFQSPDILMHKRAKFVLRAALPYLREQVRAQRDRAGVYAYDTPGNHENVPEPGWDQESDSVVLEAVRKLAHTLATPPDTKYKDDWAVGYDAGREAAGREILQQMGLSE